MTHFSQKLTAVHALEIWDSSQTGFKDMENHNQVDLHVAPRHVGIDNFS